MTIEAINQETVKVNSHWALFPVHWITNTGACSCGKNCNSPGKHPITKTGFKDASTDPEQIQAWQSRYPSCNWGARTGEKDKGGSGFFVIDIDKKSGGPETWEALRTDHPEPIETITAKTGGGGYHYYFIQPDGLDIRNKTNAWPGIDVRGNGGYVLIPPSVTIEPYTFELSPEVTELDEAPDWILEHLIRKSNNGSNPDQGTVTSREDIEKHERARMLTQAIPALKALKKSRADNYQDWLNVGLSLYELGSEGLALWDDWSKQSEKYNPGDCYQKWQTFNKDQQRENKITFASLVYWAGKDNGAPFIKEAEKGAKPSDYRLALEGLGYAFKVNTMNDQLHVNGVLMNDLYLAKVMTDLREFGYKSTTTAQDLMKAMAFESPFHPVRDYLNSLKWDGYDHIGKLTGYFTDKDGLFPELFKRWAIGAIMRVISRRPGYQNPMLVLDGPQRLGKSWFVSWLGSPLPDFYIQSPINTTDKDYLLLLASKWIWECEELGATVRRADVEALKSFLSKEMVTVRQAYAKFAIDKPAQASFIGTINNTGGFLNDYTGHRRFRTCGLTDIDWDYYTDCDINQIWAQAVAFYKQGETNDLDTDYQERLDDVNESYQVDDPLHWEVNDLFDVDPQGLEFTATAEIIRALREAAAIGMTHDQAIANRISGILTRMGCERERKMINGKRSWGWKGVRKRLI